MESNPVDVNSDRPQSPEPSTVQPPEIPFAAIVENMAEAFFALDITGCCIYLNGTAEQIVGGDRIHLHHKPLWDIFQVDPSSQLYQQFHQTFRQTAQHQVPATFEAFYPAFHRWFAVRLLPIADGVLAYFQDITERRETEISLRREQEFLNVLLDNVQAGIVACDAEGRLKLFNRVARSFHNIPEQPLPPEQWAKQYDLYLPDGTTPMQPEDIPLYRALQGQQVQDAEMMIIPKQGKARLLLASGQAINHPNGTKQGAVVVMHDITEQRQIETALRESEAQLSSIFQTIPDGIIIVNREGQITAANPAAEKILRLTRSNITERVYNDLSWAITTPEGDPFPDEALPFVQVMRTGKPVYGIEHAIAHADGTKTILAINASPLLDANGNITHVITAISDVTEQKQAETSLRQSEERYRSVIEAAAEGIVLQHRDGRIFTCNASAERILGLTQDQMMGRSSHDPRWAAIYEDGSPFPGEQHPSMVTLRTGEPQSNVTMGIHKPDGTLTWISINTRPLFQAHDPNPYAVVASFFDITDRKQASEERVRLVQAQTARALAEAAQNRAAFLADVSEVLASSLDFEQTLQSVAQLAVPYFADWCAVDRLNDDGTISRVAVAHSDPAKVQLGWDLAQRFPRRVEDGYGMSDVMKTGQSQILIEITDEQLIASVPHPEYLEILQGLGLKSCIIAPLQARGRIFGTLSFIFTESDRRYDQDDLKLAEDLARRAAIAIDNAHLYYTAQQAKQAAETAADRTARLQMVTAALSEPLTPLQVAEVIVEQSTTALDADAALVALINTEGTALDMVRSVGYEIKPEETQQPIPLNAPVPLAEAIRTGQPIWVEPLETRLTRYPHLAEAYRRLPFEAWISLPLMVEGKAIGGLSIAFKQFTLLDSGDREFILALSRQCAQAIFRTQLYEAERYARAEAEQANRVKDEFLAVLSHELRSPLNPILGWTRILRTQPLAADKTDQALATIERNAKLQAQLIEDLLDISRMLRGKLSLNSTPVDLKTVIHSAIETVQLAASAKLIQIQTGLPENAPRIMGDASRLQQVLWNLLSNAIKFTPTNGQVMVQMEERNQHIQIQVIDNGKGIHPDFLPHVFKYFRQADSSTTRQFGGLGLGLAIARQIVEMHGGTIRAESPGEGLGSTFTVCLPITVAILENSTVLERPAQSGDLAGLHILVVDDEADMRDLAEFLLLQQGAHVAVASSAAEALFMLSQRIPDVLLCDIGMPDMDGYALMRQIRERSLATEGQMRAIALTAYASEYDRRQALAAGFQRHISKPVEPDVLVKAIVEVIQ